MKSKWLAVYLALFIPAAILFVHGMEFVNAQPSDRELGGVEGYLSASRQKVLVLKDILRETQIQNGILGSQSRALEEIAKNIKEQTQALKTAHASIKAQAEELEDIKRRLPEIQSGETEGSEGSVSGPTASSGGALPSVRSKK